MNRRYITATRAGSSVITDLGRVLGPRYGVPVNGALDHYSARLANVLVGNPHGAPLIEITAADVVFVTDVDILISATGALMTFTVDGTEQRQWEPVSVRAGQTIALRNMTAGLRTYLAVHGSLQVPELLGSCAPDTVLGFGHHLSDGDRIVLRRSVPPLSNPYFNAAVFNFQVKAPQLTTRPTAIEVTDGPDLAEFAASAAQLFRGTYTLGPKSNHIGLRLSGPLPQRQRTSEMLSRGVPVGAVEVPPGDELLILHRGRGVTAGYPVLAVVTTTSLNTLAQARPGDTVVFRRVDVAIARQRAHAEHRHITTVQNRVKTVLESLGLQTQPHPSKEQTCRIPTTESPSSPERQAASAAASSTPSSPVA